MSRFTNYVKSFFVPVQIEAKQEPEQEQQVESPIAGLLGSDPNADKSIDVRTNTDINAEYTGGGFINRRWNPIFSFPFDGEKNPGEMGVIKKYWLNYRGLRNRSWQAYLENDVLQGIIGKFEEWVVGTGLRLQSKPIESILQKAGIQVPEGQAFDIEQRFQLFKSSKNATYDKEMTLNQLEAYTYKNAIVGGDMLVVLHVVEGRIEVQLIDGEHVFTPSNNRSTRGDLGGNEIRDGVEIDAKGRHVAYHVWDKSEKFMRIPAYGEGGLRRAYLVYGMRYRTGNLRGVPIDAGILESLKKIERYKEAAVAGAEERAKIAYFFEHTKESTGENPMIRQVEASLPLNRSIDGGSDTETVSLDSIKMANKITATTGKQTFNLPNETTIKSLEAAQELSFKDFFMTNLHPICAAVGIPVEVALSKFENNFSSSRAALKQWEHTVKVNRANFSTQFLKPIYSLWLIMEDVRGDIQLPRLFRSLIIDADDTLFLAYTNCEFMGVNIPHVDPVKEVEAIRKKLGTKFENVPLTTIQRAIEELGGGDFQQVMQVIEKEMDELPEDLEPEEPMQPMQQTQNAPRQIEE